MISEYTGRLKSLIGIRHAMVGAFIIRQTKFIDNLMGEYPSYHTLVNTLALNEDIKIRLGVRVATSVSMSDS